MKRFFAAALMLLMGMMLSAQNNPKADEKAVVVCGNARFTVLTDRLVRMEWAEDGKFEDNATLAIINRELPVPQFSTVRKGEGVTIKTGKLTLTYKGNGKFTDANLSVVFPMNGRSVSWKPGADASANLKGTTRTLDGCTGFGQVAYGVEDLEDGILSRDGWAIVDESARHILVKDDSDWGEWVAERPAGDRQDLYIFAYGHDYKAALADFTKVAGNIPLPPKYTLGYWWSRYWIYTDQEMLELAGEMRERQIPMDVMIVDMDWHHTWKDMEKRIGRDEFGQGRGWTGYTWNGDLFPDPEGFLKELHSMGFKTSLNLHPASGIRPYEDCYRAFRQDYLGRTQDYDGPKDYVYTEEPYQYAGVEKPAGKAGYNAPVPFRMSQKEWADAYFNSVIHPLERQGVDFWWLDWQQWRESRYVKDLSNTFWLNYTFFNDKVRQTVSQGKQAPRALIYHRWGGLGSHRYQLGFSGDTYDDWSVLAFLPYFTATASNVGYGYWGHDIGGHQQHRGKQGPTNPEVYTRWLQYGVFTPIFKTHSTQSAFLDRRIWKYEDHYQYMKEAIELRYALSPYIYDAARQCYETGVSMCRPLYYYYPEVENAYSWKEEFMFGDNILATVLCQPMDTQTGKTERKMWFPAGNDWYDMAQHKMHKGGSTKTLYYGIDQNPWYAKAGSLIPMAHEGIQNLQSPTCELRLLVVPGAGKAVYTHYEDDGSSMAYDTDFSKITFTKALSGKTLTVKISKAEGTYSGKSDVLRLSVLLPDRSQAPSKVLVNGKAVDVQASVKNNIMSVVLPELDTTAENTVVIE
ncbi:MAG: glycoside hydrolase family 31 protein [Bacteroidales bacterium]|nr:glycoside hydrolase family 31 protein [Bacteroidales bacterium]